MLNLPVFLDQLAIDLESLPLDDFLGFPTSLAEPTVDHHAPVSEKLAINPVDVDHISVCEVLHELLLCHLEHLIDSQAEEG